MPRRLHSLVRRQQPARLAIVRKHQDPSRQDLEAERPQRATILASLRDARACAVPIAGRATVAKSTSIAMALAARGKSPDRPYARDLASAGKARRGGDTRASSTTSNAVRRRQTRGALRVADGAHPSALLRLLDDAWASPASPRLLSGPAAPATRPIRLLPRAARH